MKQLLESGQDDLALLLGSEHQDALQEILAARCLKTLCESTGTFDEDEDADDAWVHIQEDRLYMVHDEIQYVQSTSFAENTLVTPQTGSGPGRELSVPPAAGHQCQDSSSEDHGVPTGIISQSSKHGLDKCSPKTYDAHRHHLLELAGAQLAEDCNDSGMKQKGRNTFQQMLDDIDSSRFVSTYGFGKYLCKLPSMDPSKLLAMDEQEIIDLAFEMATLKHELTYHDFDMPNDNQQSASCAIYDGSCTTGLCRCAWSYILAWYQQAVMSTMKELQAEYDAASEGKLKKGYFLRGLLDNLNGAHETIVKLIVAIEACQQKLVEIDAMPTGEYIQLMIQSERNSRKPGYQGRIKVLEDLRSCSTLRV